MKKQLWEIQNQLKNPEFDEKHGRILNEIHGIPENAQYGLINREIYTIH